MLYKTLKINRMELHAKTIAITGSRRLVRHFLLILPVALAACGGEKIVDLDKRGIETTTYQALPKAVQSFIENHIDSIAAGKDDIYFSTDPTINFTYAHSGIPSTGWMDENGSNYHHFFIDGLHCRMRGDRGQPFILHERVIYFCDFGLHRNNYQASPYFKVSIAD